MTPILVRHGIRTKRTRAAWIHEYKEITYRRYGSAVHIDTEKYKAGVNSIWNHLVVNPMQARSMLVEYETIINAFPGADKACAVAHSNGTNVTMSFLRLAEKQSYKFGTIVLIGSAIHSDIERSGVLELVQNGTVEKFVCYVSSNDRVVRCLESIPFFYGSLGAKGFQQNGQAVSHPRIITRTFENFGHGTYFTRENIVDTTAQINADFGLTA